MTAWLPLFAAALAFPALVAGERRWPLRARHEPQGRRVIRNLALGGIAVALEWWLLALLLPPAVALAESRGIGALRSTDWAAPVEAVAGFLGLDLALWAWHWLNHRTRVLWRFHQVHHADLDLDASTGVRFHPGELALSVGMRVAVTLLLGAPAGAALAWQTLLSVSVLFHHANLRLPIRLERVLATMLITPRLHGIHHSQVRAETDSNYGSLLSLWDRVLGTLRASVPQAGITIGIPELRAPGSVGLTAMLGLPLRHLEWRGRGGAPGGAGTGRELGLVRLAE